MSHGEALIAWAAAFAFTQLVEMPLYRRWLRVPWSRTFAASALTHPIVWFVFPRVFEEATSYVVMVVMAELFAWAVEATYFRVRCGIPLGRATLISLVANAASTLLGLGSRWAFGIP